MFVTEAPADPSPRTEAASPPAVPRTAAGAIQAGRWLYRPESWFERLDPAAMFGRLAPLEVELGSGDGSFLVEWGERHPGRNFIGVERLLGRIQKLDRKAQRRGLTHVRGLRIEASYCLEYLLPAGSVETLHVYFPDPWPKRRHRKNRLVNERFPDLAAGAVGSGGLVHLRTDDDDYFTQMRAVFASAAGFEEVATPVGLQAVTTDFEREFNARGIETKRASYRRIRVGP